MTKEEFLSLLEEEVKTYKKYLETDSNDWIVKGFIDIDKNVYTITNDTKVVSKIIEILLIPKLDKFARDNGLKLELPSKQNYYPDLTFKDDEGHLFAVDFKSSYYDGDSVNGLTLGSYWGYFRKRDTLMSMDYTYNSYSSHTVLGMLYKQAVNDKNERTVFSVDELSAIHSVIEQFVFFVQPKWKIASDIPGSGNTRNIGGITNIQKLINGQGPFAVLGEEFFDDYWMGYFNSADAQKAGIGNPHYHNLKTYKEYLKLQAEKSYKLG
ncbi:MAG: restriction endonuclease [Bacteroides sp.]|nr:restriction endonuclease [Bacteroides sp.]